jgi:hypothetical protein
MVGKVWQAAHNIAARKQRGRMLESRRVKLASFLFFLPLLFHLGPPANEMVPSAFRSDLPPYLILSANSQRHSKKCFTNVLGAPQSYQVDPLQKQPVQKK